MDKLTRIVREIGKLNGKKVKVGVLKDAGVYDNGRTVVEVAVYNELGTATMPPRAFIGDTFMQHRRDIASVNGELFNRVMAGQLSAYDSLDYLGRWYKGIIQKNMQNGGWSPLAASTIARKGHSQPLIDTRRLIQSINWEVK